MTIAKRQHSSTEPIEFIASCRAAESGAKSVVSTHRRRPNTYAGSTRACLFAADDQSLRTENQIGVNAFLFRDHPHPVNGLAPLEMEPFFEFSPLHQLPINLFSPI